MQQAGYHISKVDHIQECKEVQEKKENKMAQIGKLAKTKKAGSKYALTGTIYLLGVPISVGVKKTDKGDYIIDSFGISSFALNKQENTQASQQPIITEEI